MTLTDAAIRNAKPDDKPRKLADGVKRHQELTPWRHPELTPQAG